MRNNVLNFTFFLAVAVGLYFLYTHAEQNWLAKPQPKEPTPTAPTPTERRAAAAAVAGSAAVAVDPPAAPAPKVEPPKITPRPDPTLIPLGGPDYYNRVLLSTAGGGVQQVVLPKFAEADRLGREVPNTPLYLVPGIPRDRSKHPYLKDAYPIPDLKPGKVPAGTDLADPAFTVTHYPTPDDKYPDPRLAEVEWKVVAQEHPDGGEHKVVFETELLEPYFVRLRKTYTLGPRDYHVGLKVEVERLAAGVKGKGQFRYQLSGPRGIPIEGEWYTTTYRVALVGWLNRKGAAQRQYETAAEVAAKRGGEEVQKGAENTFKYMGVANQYFFSGVAIDDTAEGDARHPWAYVRATTELPFNRRQDPTQPQFDDVTVRAASGVIDLAPGEKRTHSYLLYSGPAKVSLLGLMGENRGTVDPALVERYRDKLGLKTVTDYHSPTWLGAFADTIYWTDLVVAFTNLMHWLLAAIHSVVPDWALSIVVLTLLVRLVLLYPSKKQTRMNLRMMETQKRLAPQFEELKKKYEGDFHGYNRAKMQLMLANGVNPAAQLGGCLLLFAQMPIMMGLYFCLQESVFFRLEHFLWIDNLAAPDMTLWWGEKIPYVSSPDNIGGITYLGPYLNVLPILAVTLMIGQQLLMLPPATDDQSRQQRTIMKMMMVMMPIFFFKFAAGLALYFIIGTIWALAERKIVGKPDLSKVGADPGPAGPSANGPAAPAPDKPLGPLGRLREAMRKKMEEMQRQADEQSRRQIRNDKDGPGPAPGTGSAPPPRRGPDRRDRNDRKKKRRK